MTPEGTKILFIISLIVGAFVIVPIIFIIICAFAGWSKLKGFGVGIVVGILNGIIIYITQVHKIK